MIKQTQWDPLETNGKSLQNAQPIVGVEDQLFHQLQLILGQFPLVLDNLVHMGVDGTDKQAGSALLQNHFGELHKSDPVLKK